MRIDLIPKDNRVEMSLVSMSLKRSFRISGWLATIIPWLILAYGFATMPPGSSSGNMASHGTILHQCVMVFAIIPIVGIPVLLLMSFFAYWIVGACGFALTHLISRWPI